MGMLILTEEQKLIQQSVKEWCEDPRTIELAKKDMQRDPTQQRAELSWKAAAEMGYIAAWVPEEYGGMGYSWSDYYLIVEEILRHGNPSRSVSSAMDLGMLPILYWGTEEQKKAFLPAMCAGEISCMGAHNDPAGNSNYPEWGITAVEDGDEWVLNGTKVTGSNVHTADIKVVFGSAEHSDFPKSVYLVPKGTPGVETGFHETRLVSPTDDWGGMNLKNVRVPKLNRIVDNGFGLKFMSVSYGLMGLSSMIFCENMFNKALEFTKQRLHYGRPLTDKQAVSHRLVNMSIMIENIRNLTFMTAKLFDEGKYTEALRYGSMAKVYGTEAATQVAVDACVLHGAVGVTKNSGFGPAMERALVLQIAEQPPDVHRDFIAETFGIHEGWKHGEP